MSFRFPHRPVAIRTSLGRPAAHPSGATSFWRPLVPIRIIGLKMSQFVPRALIDCGSQDCVFPWDLHAVIGAALRPDSGHVVRWRGVAYPLRFGDVELELTSSGITWRWPALVGFSTAPLPYVLLGYFGCQQYMDVTLRGDQLAVEIETNSSYAGRKS